MQTRLIPALLETSDGREADRILRNCVHCGFCTATCPTYQLLGDELDGPRGRIYQIKELLEGQSPTVSVRQHLDRCLTCLNCETTCPSGVEYHKLLDIGRVRIEQSLPRPLPERLLRWGLRHVLPYPGRFGPLLRLGQGLRALLPRSLRDKVPKAELSDPAAPLPPENPSKRVLMLNNCVEPALTPATVRATRRVLARLGIELLQPSGAGCCGAINQHLAAPEAARAMMRRNIDAWWPLIEPEKGGPAVDAILITASGCGAMVKDYAWHLRDDADYAGKAARVSALARDLSELLDARDLAQLPNPIERGVPRQIAFHPPCSLQHGQRLMGRVESLLASVGFSLTPVRDAHRCCGSAGTYSILQPGLAERLRTERLDALQAGDPALIATANVGCQTHLVAAAQVPVVHWIELFDSDG